jgi:hypothetical protein
MSSQIKSWYESLEKSQDKESDQKREKTFNSLVDLKKKYELKIQ